MEKWNSRLGFILATIGSAVGIGNIWRFSSVVGQNGGGAYLIPFLISIFAFGIPLMILELTVGRCLKGDVVSIFRKVGADFEVFGWVIWGVVFGVLSYYLVIVGWTLAYFVSAITDSIVIFNEFTSSFQPVLYFFITTILTGIIVSKGVKKGIERITTLLIPVAFLILIGMAIYSITLPGFSEGVAYLFTPDYSVLSDPLIWSAALGQAFFSLSVGFGTLITYGNYLEDDINISNSSIIITLADLSAAILSGIVIFAIVFSYGLSPTLGTELAFNTLPQAFANLPNGKFIASAFFLLIFLAGFTSSISMIEVNVSVFEEKFKITRKRAATLISGFALFFGLPSALSYSKINFQINGVKFLDLMDETVGTLGLPLTALIISIIFTWFTKNGLNQESCKSKTVNKIIEISTQYLIPVVLFFIISMKIINDIDFIGWHILQNIPFIGNTIQAAFVMLIIILLVCYKLVKGRK